MDYWEDFVQNSSYSIYFSKIPYYDHSLFLPLIFAFYLIIFFAFIEKFFYFKHSKNTDNLVDEKKTIKDDISETNYKKKKYNGSKGKKIIYVPKERKALSKENEKESKNSTSNLATSMDSEKNDVNNLSKSENHNQTINPISEASQNNEIGQNKQEIENKTTKKKHKKKKKKKKNIKPEKTEELSTKPEKQEKKYAIWTEKDIEEGWHIAGRKEWINKDLLKDE